MYQVVAVSESPMRRLLLASFAKKAEAVDHAGVMPSGATYEVVDDRTGLLKTVVKDGAIKEILTPTRREIVA